MNKKPIHKLNLAQLTGLAESHLVAMPCGNKMQEQAASAFASLQGDACEAGYELAIASSFRSFERQAAIWNGKACGARPVHDDTGVAIDTEQLSSRQLLHAILRFSALPGTSRHHWGSDVDVYDIAAVDAGYAVQLTPQEVGTSGVFDAFHCWLDERIAADESHGFFRPYARDTGGVAVERWHLSYAPISVSCAGQLSAAVINQCWDGWGGEIMLRGELQAELPAIMQRYMTVEQGWCPAKYR